ncbi:retrovirus-related pol polyprotein from transposon TNT 1-94 [Tanacetum coccineum]|uniref:Retrovirus-related pol polyprotein from transposon TNT 1-94 n=1 Tax=Tanacetum coccineum TaxID=301880 RepID=A0ABQ5B8U6_9ASTR
MSGTIPPIPPPFGASSGNLGSPNVNRVDTMPATTDPINTMNTTNVSQSVVDENLPQLLDLRRGSHVTNVPAFDKEDFTSWKVRFLVFLAGLEPYLLKTLDDGPFCKTAKEMWNDLILAHEGPSDRRDTKIAALRLKFNAFKSLKGEKVNGTFTRLKCLLNDLENNGVTIPQVEDNDLHVEEDKRTSNEFMADLNAEYHERALLENQKRFYKRSGRDEPSVGKADARSGQWVDITMKKVEGKKKISSKEVVFTKAGESSSTLVPKITSDSESECDSQEPLPPLPKLIGAAPSSISESLISLSDLTLNMVDLTLDTPEPKKMRPSVKVLPAYVIKKKTEKSPIGSKPCSNKKADSSTEQLLLTLIEETKCSTCGSIDHLTKEHLEHAAVKKTLSKLKAQSHLKPSPKKTPMIPKPFIECKYCGFNDHHSDHCEFYPGCEDYLKRSVCYLDSGCSRHMTGIKQYLHRYSKSQGTIYNQNDKVVLIALRRREVYVIDMSSFNKESNACFFAKASPSVNWLWHKRLSHLNFKNINNLAKHNLVFGLPSLTFFKDKNCSACKKRKHHRASFKTKRLFSINKSLHLLNMDLFRHVKPQTISHNKYTPVLVDEYSRYTWVFCLKKKGDAADCIMSFIRKMENLNEVRVKELRSDNGTEFRNHKLEELCDEKDISQNFSSPYTPEQNGVAERRNRTLIEAAKTISIIVKIHRKTAYDVFRGRSLDISYFHVFGCPVHIHNHRDHLGKFDEKSDDGFFLGYSLVAKAFRVFNIRRQEIEETVHVTFNEDDEDSVSPEDPPEFTEADNQPALNELDQPESVDILKSAETQDNVIIKPINDI